MVPKRMTSTIIVPAYNEAANIGFLLTSLISQSEERTSIKKIVVVSDGSTDDTSSVVKKIMARDTRIVLIDDGKRKGKLARLEQEYRKLRTDLVIQLDADIGLVNESVIDEMAAAFDGEKVALVAANARPLKGKSIFSRLLNSWSAVWYDAKSNFREGNNIHMSRGCSLAMRTDFARTVIYQKGTFSDSQYLYLLAKSKGLSFRLAKNSLVVYRKPENLRDYIRQLRRSSPESEHQKISLGNWVKDEYRIPRKLTFRALKRHLLSDPVNTLLGLALTKTVDFLFIPKSTGFGSKTWQTSLSTKQAIKMGET